MGKVAELAQVLEEIYTEHDKGGADAVGIN
jgi:hypothetical protein